ncbi:hypothetical protein ZWY2020_020540 [Hordeum vulgare]|nr:hypothetical protein ZWY2020_020540 [Hordeum vulgare]
MGMCSCCCRCLEIMCAILLPPLGVCLRHGCCSMEFWISVLLTILGYLPGVLYAAYVICSVDPERVCRVATATTTTSTSPERQPAAAPPSVPAAWSLWD